MLRNGDATTALLLLKKTRPSVRWIINNPIFIYLLGCINIFTNNKNNGNTLILHTHYIRNNLPKINDPDISSFNENVYKTVMLQINKMQNKHRLIKLLVNNQTLSFLNILIIIFITIIIILYISRWVLIFCNRGI